MSRWPSLVYLIHRDSRAELLREREKLLAHCRACGCMVCQVRLVMMGESFVASDVEVVDFDLDEADLKDLKHLIN